MRWIRLDRFRRITTSGALIPEIDGLRFIAILSVILFHACGEFLHRMYHGLSLGDLSGASAVPVALRGHELVLRMLGHGNYGVEVFFAISGFVLAWPFARQYRQRSGKVRLGAYFLRRVTRLEPPYILSLIIRAIIISAIGLRQAHALLIHLLASVFYVHNIAFGEASTINAVAWSLEIEVQFYCIMPLFSQIFMIPRAWVRRIILTVVIVSATPLQRTFLPDGSAPNTLSHTIIAFYQFFLAGVLVADLYTDQWERIPHTVLWDLTSIPLWFYLFWTPLNGFFLWAPMLLPFLFVAAFKGTIVRGFLRNPIVSAIGGMCYSIYLTHRTMIVFFQGLLAHLHWAGFSGLLLSLCLMVPLSIMTGAIYFVLVERPCMDKNWPQKLTAYLRQKMAIPPTPEPVAGITRPAED